MFKLFRPAPKPASRPSPTQERRRHLLTEEEARTPPTPADMVLSTAGQKWLQSLAPGIRPAELARIFPRIANRFALVWPDPVLTQHYFDSLMIDRRGNRKGFAPKVLEELIDLRAHYTAQTPAVRHTAQLAMNSIEFE